MRIVFGLCLIFVLNSCSLITNKSSKINGVSLVASKDSISETHIKPILNINANFAAVMPFGFIKNLKHPEIVFNSHGQWFGETESGTKQNIQALRATGIKTMMKPQIWVWNGEYTGLIEMDSEENWKMLETTYSKFILKFAQVAQETHTEILCIGTELELFVENRPEFWIDLIIEIRKVYKGKLTYAANWDEFKRTPFWNQIDYIGVDAYFPVSDSKTPTIEECLEGWLVHKATLKEVSDKFNKPVLFTEYGYRNVDFSGKEPWVSDRNMESINFEAQNNTTQALLETFWEEDWFAGGFIWKWFHNHEKSGGEDNNQFTPQNKPVESIIKAHYGL
ncbi:glycoside hydrolase family 113 [Xanthomarina sp. GH4-25]|uniref:glycoside hydrolase family 113 n=1 Tax=Xanthomarina sp. GH4-25 TaxID=3349335 RepID=UPI003877B51C